ncbi:MAG: ATP-binding cassette domain-containing protein [Firmicutes bacterium]|nr:ATP-binding cassette domain-containing protein [Bacillota bacterium]
MEYILKTNLLTKQFKQQKAVDGISIQIERGAIYGLIGRNGAGKTTFLRMISGLAKPTSGEMELMDMSSANGKINTAFERVGCLIEQPGIYKNMNAFENLKLKAMCCGVHSKDYINQKLALVGLDYVGKKAVGNFSLGMKQRLGIAMAMVGEPDLLVLDEPINGLDPQGIIEVRDIIQKINHEQNVTIVISSHILEELSKIATHYGIINNGKLLEQLSRSELMDKCAERLEIVTDTPEQACVVLDELGGISYKVVDKQTIHVLNRVEDSALINANLSKAGIPVQSMGRKNESLEDYFIELISKAN